MKWSKPRQSTATGSVSHGNGSDRVLTAAEVALVCQALGETADDEERTTPNMVSVCRSLLVEIQDALDAGGSVIIPPPKAKVATSPKEKWVPSEFRGAKRTVLDALECLETVRRKCEPVGIEVVVKQPNATGRPTAHVMFNSIRSCKRLADYWPGTGTVLMSHGRFSARSLDHAADMAMLAS